MTPLTLVQFLLGSRDAILRVARSRQVIWIGLLFVFAAGFAREYDGEDLLAEPWHVLIPLAASVGTSAALFLIVRGVAALHGDRERGLVSRYLDFLGLYWMTAPLALLYAIPVERFWSAADSVRANLWLLAIVAGWRVLLMSRIVSVIYQAPSWKAFALVMLFSDTLAWFLLAATPLPIVQFMGGIRLTESEAVLQMTVIMLYGLTTLSWPLWLILALVAVFRRREKWQYLPVNGPTTRASWPLWGLAALAAGVWVFVLPFTQPEQQLRRRVERDLRRGRIEQALLTMSQHEPSDFPPHWDPPPRLAYGERQPDLAKILDYLRWRSVKPWVRRVFQDKFGDQVRSEIEYFALVRMNQDEIADAIARLEQLETRSDVVRERSGELGYLIKENVVTGELKQRVQRLLTEAGEEAPH